MTKICAALAVLALMVFAIPASLAGNVASSVAGTQESDVGTVNVSLDLGNGYIVYGGQPVSAPSTDMLVTAGSDITFAAEADTGYTLDSVVVRLADGSSSTLNRSPNGTYTIGSTVVKGGIRIKLNTTKEAVDLVETTESVTELEQSAQVEEATEDTALDQAEEATNPEEAANLDEPASPDDAIAPGQDAAEPAQKPASPEAPAAEPQSVYTFEDSAVAVTATLSDPTAIPTGAQFKVTRVTPSTNGYNYDAYMEALNSSQNPNSGESTYSDQNTLLYDVAFIVDGKEYEPAAGSVTVNFTFKKDQLTKDLDATAQDASDIQITHLSIPESKLEAAGTTSAATNISAGEITVEPIANADKAIEVSGSVQTAEFKTDSFSLYAFSNAVDSGSISVSIKFLNADGSAMSSAPDLHGSHLYVYLRGDNNKSISQELTWNGSAYATTVSRVQDGSGSHDLVSGADYEVKLFASTEQREASYSPDQNQVSFITNDGVLAEAYGTTLPSSTTAKPGTIYEADATVLPALTVAVKFETKDGSAVSTVPDLSNGEKLYAFVVDPSNGNKKVIFKLNKGADGYAGSTALLWTQDNGNGKVALSKDASYSVKLYTSTSDLPNNLDSAYDVDKLTSGKTELASGMPLATSYILEFPATATASLATSPYVVRAIGMGDPGSDNYLSILGSCINFGVVTNVYTQNGGDAETNVAAKLAKCATWTGNDLTNHVEQTFMFGQVDTTFNIKGEPAWVIIPEAYKDNVRHENPNKITYDTSYSTRQIDAMVQALLGHAGRSSELLMSRQPNALPAKESNGKYTLDVSGRGAGTYYVKVDEATFSDIMGGAERLNIIKDDDQTVVFNVDTPNAVNMQKFAINGRGTDTLLGGSDSTGANLGQAAPDITKTVVWNFPNASSVNITGSMTGILLAPSATVTVNATSSGWLIADYVNIGSGEWHNTYDKVEKLSTEAILRARKTINGDDAQVDGFTFALEELVGTTWSPVSGSEAHNYGSFVTFPAIEYTGDTFVPDVANGVTQTHVYRITESAGATAADGTSYAPDKHSYYAKVVVTKSVVAGENNTTVISCTATQPAYYASIGAGNVLSDPIDVTKLPTFDNKAGASGSISFAGVKSLDYGTLNPSNYVFKVYEGEFVTSEGVADLPNVDPLVTGSCEANGAASATSPISFDSIPYDLEDMKDANGDIQSTAYKHYTVVEAPAAEGADDGVVYSTTAYIVDVTLTYDPSVNANKINASYSVRGKTQGEAVPDDLSFVNTVEKGDLTVTKILDSGFAEDQDVSFKVTVTLSDGNFTKPCGDMNFVNGVATLSLTPGVEGRASATATDLPAGLNYTVTEELSAEDGTNIFVASYEGQTGTIVAGKTSIATVTNKRKTGGFKLSKQVSQGLPSDEKNHLFSFKVELADKTFNSPAALEPAPEGQQADENVLPISFSGGVATVSLSGGQTAIADGLPVGMEYTITEVDDSSFDVAGGNTDSPNVYKGTILMGQTSEVALSEVAFKNTRKTGDLAITKTVVSDNDEDLERDEFKFTIALFEKPDNTPISGTFVAHKNAGNDSVETTVTFDDKGISGPIKLKHGETFIVEGLPDGAAYTVTEAKAEGYVTSYVGNEGTITAGEEAQQAKFTNTRANGGLAVSKRVVSASKYDRESAEFQFTVTLSDDSISGHYGSEQGGMDFEKGVARFPLTGGSQKVASGLPQGITYTVTEERADGFETMYTGDTTPNTLLDSTTKQIICTNTRLTGGLAITKSIVGTAVTDTIFTFTVDLGTDLAGQSFSLDGSANGEKTISLDENGRGEVMVKAGTAATITGIPVGTAYTVTEQDLPGYTPRQGVVTGKVVAGDDPIAAAFTNEHQATGEATIKGLKTLIGRDMNKGLFGWGQDEFTFELRPVTNGAPMPGNKETAEAKAVGSAATADKPNEAAFAFAPISFSMEDLKVNGSYVDTKTFEYKIIEKDAKGDGIVNDPKLERLVSITVRDNGTETLECTVNYGENATAVVYKNSYRAETTLNFAGKKSLDGRELIASQAQDGPADAFSFVVVEQGTGEGGALNPLYGPRFEAAVSNDGTTIAYPQITYVYDPAADPQRDDRGEHVYLVYERQDGMPTGVTADAASYLVTVNVTDTDKSGNKLADGTLRAETSSVVKYDAGNNDITPAGITDQQLDFTNTYAAQGSVSLTGVKTLADSLDNAMPMEAGAFSFGVYSDEACENPVLMGDEALTGTNSANGTISFSPAFSFSYSNGEQKAQAIGDHTYYVKETGSNMLGATLDDSVKRIVVKVEDSKDANDKPTYDGTLDVSVYDANGALLASNRADATAGATMSFANGYDANGEVGLTATKAMGRPFKNGDKFTFTVLPGEGTPESLLPSKSSVTLDGSASGIAGETSATLDFGTFKYGLADAGRTYSYVIEESGSGDDITPETASQTITVEVGFDIDESGKRTGVLPVSIYDANHVLLASNVDGVKPAATLSFSNAYRAQTSVQLEGTKSMTGRALEANDNFTFAITEQYWAQGADLAGDPTSTQQRGATTVGSALADGAKAITFPAFSYVYDTAQANRIDQRGTYVYTIEEVTEGLPASVTPDGSRYVVTVTVATSDAGELTANVDSVVKYDAAGNDVTPEGGLTASGIDFVNYRSAGGVEIGGAKRLEGRSFKAGDTFTFTLAASQSGNANLAAVPLPNPASTTVTIAGSAFIDKQELTFTLPEIPLAQQDVGKTYYYDVTESAVTSTGNAITRDTTVKTVMVTDITDNGDGTITASVEDVTEGGVLFTNAYKASGSIALNGTKTIANRGFADDDSIDFKLEAATAGAPMPAGDGASFTLSGFDGTAASTSAPVEFGTIDFTQDDVDPATGMATYVYTITETASMQGVSVKTNSKKVTVQVQDKYDGTLDVVALDEDGTPLAADASSFAFVNTYDDAQVDLNLAGSKSVTGRPDGLLPNDAYTYSVYLNDDPTQCKSTGASDASGAITFTPLHYTQADIGQTYSYTVHEDASSVPGVTASTQTHTFTVTVGYDPVTGKLTATPSYAEGDTNINSLDFTNTYRAEGTLSFSGTKSMEGRNLASGDTYTFTVVENLSDGTTREIGTATSTASNAAGLSSMPIEYPTITYVYDPAAATPRDDRGPHTYTITETTADANGVTVDKTSYTVKVTVSDDPEHGKLAVTDTTDDGVYKKQLNFTNSYEGAGELVLSGTKTLTGPRDLADLSSYFLFDVYEEGKTDGPVVTGTCDASGTITFPAITYTQAHIGEHKYVISERNTRIPGVSYSKQRYEVTATVSYDPTSADPAVLKVTTTGAPIDALDFENGFTFDEVEATLDPVKTLTGADISKERYRFIFELYEVTSPAQQEGTLPEAAEQLTLIEQVTSDGVGNIAFSPLRYTAPGDYTYVIHEVAHNPRLGGVTYDGDDVRATVKVRPDDSEGANKLTVTEITYSKANYPDATKAFYNDYSAADTSVELSATKVLEGMEWGNASYGFILEAAEGTPMPDGATTAEGRTTATANATTATNEAGQHVASFGSITYRFADLANGDENGTYADSKTFTYTIREALPAGVSADNPVLNGVHYDTSLHKVEVTVTDLQNGTLGTEVLYDGMNTNPPVFTNTRLTDAYAVLQAQKTLAAPGVKLAAGDFSFELTGTSENAQATHEVVTNAADGSVSFTGITYDNVGTYSYEISELPGDKLGMVYDKHVHTATVVVSEVDGKLEAAVSYDGNQEAAPVFTNSYFEAEAAIGLTKYYFGKRPAAFEFTLTAVNANWIVRSGTPESYVAGAGGAQASIVDDGSKPLVLTAYNGAFGDDSSARVDFPAIAYTAPGTYYYVLAEKDKDGYVTDTANYLVTVVVDNDMNATASYQLHFGDAVYDVDAADVAFYNNNAIGIAFMALGATGYTTGESAAVVYPTVRKTLDDTAAGINAGDFAFALTDAETGRTWTAVNDSTGQVAFFEPGSAGLRFSQDDIGTHRYTITELSGGATIEGVTYDDKTIELTINVTQGNDGSLVAEASYSVDGVETDDPVFDNTTEGTDLRLQKVSRMGGEGLEDCTYGLWLVNPSGADLLLDEAVTDSDGWMTFENVQLQVGSLYYFKEVEAPAGHKVDPYRSVYMTPVYDEITGHLVLEVAESTSDNLHSSEG